MDKLSDLILILTILAFIIGLIFWLNQFCTGTQEKVDGEDYNATRAIARSRKLQKVLMEAASGYLEVNLSKNTIIGNVIDYTPDGEPILLEIPELGGRSTYDDFTQWWSRNMLVSDTAEFLKVSNCAHLLSCFQRGERVVNVFCTSRTSDHTGLREIRQTYYMSQDDPTGGDITALCLVTEISEEARLRHERSRQEKAIRECVELLHHETEADKAMGALLAIVAKYYNASRAYVVEVSHDRTLVNCTYEWYREGGQGVRDTLQNLPISEVQDWFESCESKGATFLKTRVDELDTLSDIRSLMVSQATSQIFLAPLLQNGTITGFLAVDDPKNSVNDKTILRTTAALAYSEILRRKQTDEEHVTLEKLAENVISVSYADLAHNEMHNYGIAPQLRDKLDWNLPYSQLMKEIVYKLVSLEDREKCAVFASPGLLMDQLEGQESLRYTFSIDLDGEQRYMTLDVARANAKGTAAVLIATDNTDAVAHEVEAQRRLAEALEKAEVANRAKSAFLFNMSHDIRTPMNAVMGFTSMAERNLENPEVLKDCLSKVHASSEYLLQLINDILDVARIESEKMSLLESASDILVASGEIADVFRAQMSEKQVTLKTDFSGVKDTLVWQDNLRVRQVVVNILSNAMKFTPPGGTVEYVITQEESDQPGYGKYVITIRDNGIGMSEEFQGHIYEKFSQEYSATQSHTLGTGLGMSIVRSLVDMMKGTIRIQSKLGEGTTVVLTIPWRLAQPADLEPVKESAPVEAPQVSLAGKRVLLVEDNELNLEIARNLLQEAGIQVTEATNGAEALRIIQTQGPTYFDCVLMDIQMPVMNGYEATRHIRRSYPGRRIPIVALSANAFEEDKRKSLNIGMDDHVAKPVHAEELLQVLRRVMA